MTYTNTNTVVQLQDKMSASHMHYNDSTCSVLKLKLKQLTSYTASQNSRISGEVALLCCALLFLFFYRATFFSKLLHSHENKVTNTVGIFYRGSFYSKLQRVSILINRKLLLQDSSFSTSTEQSSTEESSTEQASTARVRVGLLQSSGGLVCP